MSVQKLRRWLKLLPKGAFFKKGKMSQLPRLLAPRPKVHNTAMKMATKTDEILWKSTRAGKVASPLHLPGSAADPPLSWRADGLAGALLAPKT